MINIRSCSSNRELRISCASDSYLLAELVGIPVSAKVEVWVETAMLPGFKRSLPGLASMVDHGLAHGNGSRLKGISSYPRPVLHLAMLSSTSSCMDCRARLKNGPSPLVLTTNWANSSACFKGPIPKLCVKWLRVATVCFGSWIQADIRNGSVYDAVAAKTRTGFARHT